MKAVLYERLENDESMQSGDVFDCTSIAVTFVFETDVRYSLRWHLRHWSAECLSSEHWGPNGPIPRTQAIDVSHRWFSFVGNVIVDQFVAIGETGWGVRQPWATRLLFSNGNSIAVALGDLRDDGTPTYLPDALVLTSNEDAACAYLAATGESAWALRPLS